ncbi:MAG: hypothetical protein K2Y27_00145 [Xanthobacteraceae bacterium]|nr:hypothetical protein [Xanthobacteraceae bacterium]
MLRTIQVSLDVFQAIWTKRQPNETSEDAILRRVLQVPAPTAAPPTPAPGSGKAGLPRDIKVMEAGFHDPRYDVILPPNFEIFRTYKGKHYIAQAIQGFWIYGDTGYPTLNELNSAIGITHENAWKAWRYKDQKGRTRPLSDLRNQSKIIRRQGKTIDDLL